MNEKIQSCNIKITPITPVYIGGASEKNWCQGLDYIYDEDNWKLHILDHQKIALLLGKEKMNGYIDAILKRKAGEFITNLCEHQNIEISELESLSFVVTHQPENDVKAFIRDGMGRPYIPGTSLKGAIRSVLFNRFFERANYHERGPTHSRLSDFVFGTIGNNLMRFLQVSDIIFNDTEIFVTKIFNLSGNGGNMRGGWKHARINGTSTEFSPEGFTTAYETLEVGKPGKGTIKINNLFKEQLKNPPPNFNRLLTQEPLIDLFRLINNYTTEHLDREIEFFETYPNDETGMIIEEMRMLKTITSKAVNSCILRMACGSGFHGITGDWQFMSHHIDGIHANRGRNRGVFQGMDSAKSRKIAFANYEELGLQFKPMGFVRITVSKD